MFTELSVSIGLRNCCTKLPANTNHSRLEEEIFTLKNLKTTQQRRPIGNTGQTLSAGRL